MKKVHLQEQSWKLGLFEIANGVQSSDEIGDLSPSGKTFGALEERNHV